MTLFDDLKAKILNSLCKQASSKFNLYDLSKRHGSDIHPKIFSILKQNSMERSVNTKTECDTGFIMTSVLVWDFNTRPMLD